MKKICIILFLTLPGGLQTSKAISPSETASIKSILSEQPQLVYHRAHDINKPKMRSGQYQRNGELKSQDFANNQKYFIGQHIDKTTLERRIVIEESTDAKEPVYKVLSGCSNGRIGYIKRQKKAIALYPFDPIKANIDALSREIISHIVDWATEENENKTAKPAKK